MTRHCICLLLPAEEGNGHTHMNAYLILLTFDPGLSAVNLPTAITAVASAATAVTVVKTKVKR